MFAFALLLPAFFLVVIAVALPVTSRLRFTRSTLNIQHALVPHQSQYEHRTTAVIDTERSDARIDEQRSTHSCSTPESIARLGLAATAVRRQGRQQTLTDSAVLLFKTANAYSIWSFDSTLLVSITAQAQRRKPETLACRVYRRGVARHASRSSCITIYSRGRRRAARISSPTSGTSMRGNRRPN